MIADKSGAVSPGVYSVAWFKLAEFVGRKEKERAFGVYRLLAHSISDVAFAAQLEGDLFMAFHDDRATDLYKKAALLYEQEGRLTHAALVYEQLMVLQPENKEHAERAIKLYAALHNEMKVIKCARQLLTLLIRQSAFATVEHFFSMMSEVKPDMQNDLYETAVYALCTHHPERSDLIEYYIDLLHRSPHKLSLLLARLSHVQPQAYQHVLGRLNNLAERTTP